MFVFNPAWRPPPGLSGLGFLLRANNKALFINLSASVSSVFFTSYSCF